MANHGKITLPYETPKDIEAAAMFINNLVATGTAVFEATIESGRMIIEFTGGY